MHKIVFFAVIATSLSFFPMIGYSDSFHLGGIQVNELNPEKWVKTLKQEHMNTVAVTTYSYQAAWDSDQLNFKKENPGLIKEIRTAKANGLHVVLILRRM